MIVEYQNLQQKIIAIIINEQSVSDAVSFLGEIKTFREKIEKQKKESVIELKEKIKDRFTPELINRLDRICFFNNLSLTDLTAIAELEISNLNRRLAKYKTKIY